MGLDQILQIAVLGALAIIGYFGKKTVDRLDSQDHELAGIRDLLASEVKHLREMQHSIDVRVTRVEERCAITLHGGNHGAA